MSGAVQADVQGVRRQPKVGGGRVAQVFIGETKGFFKADLKPEDLRDNWDTVTAKSGYGPPSNLAEETAMFLPFFA